MHICRDIQPFTSHMITTLQVIVEQLSTSSSTINTEQLQAVRGQLGSQLSQADQLSLLCPENLLAKHQTSYSALKPTNNYIHYNERFVHFSKHSSLIIAVDSEERTEGQERA